MPAEKVRCQAVVHLDRVIHHGTRPVGNANPHKLAERLSILQHDSVAVNTTAFTEL
jgi:hypothetical protein